MRTLLLTLLLAQASMLVAQAPAADDTTRHDSPKAINHYSTLGEFMRSGSFEVHLRSFSMATLNRGELLDYSTSAFGGGIGYYSPEFKGLHFGLSGFFAFQLFENNIRIADPSTGAVNRYEILLYDMNDLSNVDDFDRLEELYIAYHRKGFRATLGRHLLNTPLINEQDNRMRHNIFNGLTLNYDQGPWHFNAGWYTDITMRGTVEWYRVEESFGVYPFGRNPLGTPSGYRGNIRSAGIGILGMVYHLPERMKLQVWNYTSDNVFNLTFGQAEMQWPAGKGSLHGGLQGLWQEALNHGGNELPEATYMDADSKGLALGGTLGYAQGHSKISLNMLRIAAEGRFLFPREWGREQLFVSLPRERHEGNGDVWAFTAKYERPIGPEGMRLLAGAGYVRNPSIDNFRLNKYGVPSYYHFVGGLHHSFQQYFKGLELDVLIAQKTATDPDEVPDEFRINRVDMWNFNLVMNYRF